MEVNLTFSPLSGLAKNRGRFYFLFLPVSHGARLSALKNMTVHISCFLFFQVKHQKVYIPQNLC